MTVSTSVQHTDADTLNQYAVLLGLTPEQLAPDAWATTTEFSRSGPCVVHHRELPTSHGFTSYLSRLVLEETPGTTEVTVQWGDEYSGEEFSIPVDKIPAIIDVLTEARDAHGTGSNALEAMRAIEDQRAALAARQKEVLKQLLSDLEWMDVPVRRLSGIGVMSIVSDVTFGARVHLVRQYAEDGYYDNTSAHLLDDCGWYCGGPGNTVKGSTRQRWRYHCLGEFEYIGSTDTDGHTDYLFSPVTP